MDLARELVCPFENRFETLKRRRSAFGREKEENCIALSQMATAAVATAAVGPEARAPPRGSHARHVASRADALMRLPGVNATNYRAVVREVDSLAELATLPERRLATLIGTANAAQLHRFLHEASQVGD